MIFSVQGRIHRCNDIEYRVNWTNGGPWFTCETVHRDDSQFGVNLTLISIFFVRLLEFLSISVLRIRIFILGEISLESQ